MEVVAVAEEVAAVAVVAEDVVAGTIISKLLYFKLYSY